MYSTIGPRFQKNSRLYFQNPHPAVGRRRPTLSRRRPTSADPQPTVGRAKQKGTVESQLGMSGIGKPSHIQRM